MESFSTNKNVYKFLILLKLKLKLSRAAKCDSQNNKLKILKIDVYINILHENNCVRKKSKKKISVNFVEFYSIVHGQFVQTMEQRWRKLYVFIFQWKSICLSHCAKML
jgi:hypothetical protein